MTDTNTTETPKKRTLLDIADDMAALDQLLYERGGDITDPEVEKLVDEFMAELARDLDSKVDAYCGLIRQKELIAAARREEAERLLMSAKAEENQVKWLKDRLKGVLEFLGIKKAGRVRSATVCNNGGKLPLIIPEIAPQDIPERFQKVVTTITIDEDKVRAALDAGEDLGTFARYGERGTHVRIK